MEILSEHTNWTTFIFAVSAVAIIALLCILAIVGIVVGGICDGGDILGVSIMGLFATGLLAVLYFGIQQGPDVEYKAIVTDYNEVYDAGYTVVGTEGKIVTLTKEDGK